MKQLFIIFGSFVFIFLNLAGCASKEENPNGLSLISQMDYEKIIDASSRSDKKYSGLYNTMDLSTTLVSTRVAQAQLEQSARIYQWDKAKFQLEKNKSDEKLKDQTLIFLSFYTPESKNNDLHKPKTVWKIFFDTNGRRYEGKVTKLSDSPAEIRGLYPYYEKFATAYTISFPIATAEAEKQNSKLTITGPVDSATVEFLAAQPL